MIDMQHIVGNIPDYVKKSLINVVPGAVTVNGIKHDCYALVLDRLLAKAEIDNLLSNTLIIEVSTGHYNYAPEIKKSVIYLQRVEV